MADQISAASHRRRAGDSLDYPNAQKRHHGRRAGEGQRAGNAARVDFVAAAVKRLLTLRIGPVVQATGETAGQGRGVLFSLCR